MSTPIRKGLSAGFKFLQHSVKPKKNRSHTQRPQFRSSFSVSSTRHFPRRPSLSMSPTMRSLSSATQFRRSSFRPMSRSSTLASFWKSKAATKPSVQLDALALEASPRRRKPVVHPRVQKKHAVSKWLKHQMAKSRVRRARKQVHFSRTTAKTKVRSSGQPKLSATAQVKSISRSRRPLASGVSLVTLSKAKPPAKRPTDALVIYRHTRPLNAMVSLGMTAKKIEGFGKELQARTPVLFNSQQLLQGKDVILPLKDPDVAAYYKLWSGQSGEAQAESDPKGFVMNQSPVFKQALDTLVALGYPDPLDTPRDSKFEQDILSEVNRFARNNDRLPTIDELRGIFAEVGKKHPVNALQKLKMNEDGELEIGNHNYNFKLVWNTFSEVLAMKTALAGIPVKSFGLEEHPLAAATIQAMVELPAVERGAIILAGQLGDLVLEMEYAVVSNSLFMQPKERDAVLRATRDIRAGAEAFRKGAILLRAKPTGSQSAQLRIQGSEMMAKGSEQFQTALNDASKAFRTASDKVKARPGVTTAPFFT